VATKNHEPAIGVGGIRQRPGHSVPLDREHDPLNLAANVLRASVGTIREGSQKSVGHGGCWRHDEL
jgi:hypothetical protein